MPAVAEPVKAAPVFTPPHVGGRMVLWYQYADPQATPVPAVVQSGNNQGSLTITLIPVGASNLRTMYGVLHLNDPRLKKLEDAKIANGGWDLLPEDREQQKRLAALEAQIQEWQASVQQQMQFIEELATESKAKK